MTECLVKCDGMSYNGAMATTTTTPVPTNAANWIETTIGSGRIDPSSEDGRDFLVAAANSIGYANYESANPSRSPIVGLPAELQRVTWRTEIFTAYTEGFDQAGRDATWSMEMRG